MSAPSRALRRKFWHRWLIDPIHQQLTQGVSPEKIALTLALGSALALFPVLGTTTLLCLTAGVVLSLNQPILQAINALCGFIWIPLLVAFVHLGDILTGSSSSSVNVSRMFSLFRQHPGQFFQQFGVTALHGILGWTVTAPFWIPLVYFAVRGPLRAAAIRLKHRHATHASGA
jgi:uncharacterized protein (DUF2062 family)